jgi:hypothetical protein
MTVKIPNSTGGGPPPDPPARPDGQPYAYELVAPAWRGYADTFTGLASLLIDGYGGLGGEDARQEARLRYAADVQVPVQAALAQGADLGACSDTEKQALLGARDKPPAVGSWTSPVPLVLVTAFYQPAGDLAWPRASGPGKVIWIDPSSDETLLVSLHEAGWVTVNARAEG